MRQTITATQKTLYDVFFGDGYSFEIPSYQRPYSWTIDQTDALLDDLDTAIGHDQNNVEGRPPYFLGSVVLIIDSEVNTSANTRANVVDGQQRLTTLTILFSVLRSLADEGERGLISKYILTVADKYARKKDGFRLTLRKQDRDFFKDYIQKEGGIEKLLGRDSAKFSDSWRNICDNARCLWNKLREYPSDRRNLLMEFLLNQCYLVVVCVSDPDSAHRVFSVMNDRGLPLLPTDILKADIIGLIKDSDCEDRCNTEWEEIEDRLGRDNFRKLFAHVRMIHMKKKQDGTLNQEFRKHVFDKFTGTASEFIYDVLSPYAKAYRIVSKADYSSTENAEGVKKYLWYLNSLENEDWMPPAIEFFRKHEDEEKLIQFMRDLERLAYGLLIQQANVNKRIKRYANVLTCIGKGDDDNLFAIESPLQLQEEEKADIKRRLDGEIYAQMPVRTLSLLLRRLNTLITEDVAIYTHYYPTVEHVLPQNPNENSQWLEWFPEEKDRQFWVHRLANLVLLSHRKNSSASNRDFEKKKNTYFRKGNVTIAALTVSVLDEKEWTPEVLERRQRNLRTRLEAEWRL